MDNPLRKPSAAGVKQEALDGMVVQCTERVRDVQPMMPGVEFLIEVCVRVHRSVQKVLPGVDDEPDGGSSVRGVKGSLLVMEHESRTFPRKTSSPVSPTNR